MAELRGYIISANHWADNIALRMGCWTFGTTATEAWCRHLGAKKCDTITGDLSKQMNAWVDKNYGPRKVIMHTDQERSDAKR